MVHQLATCDVIVLHCPVPLDVVIESLNKRYIECRVSTETKNCLQDGVRKKRDVF
jgi:hypothetical protein